MFEVEKDQANLVSSNIKGKPLYHLPVLDIDLPAALVPSSQKDHYHLYIEKEVEEGSYFRLLDALAECGIIEKGYADASKAKGGTFVRVPGVTKPWIEQAQERAVVGTPDPVEAMRQHALGRAVAFGGRPRGLGRTSAQLRWLEARLLEEGSN
jgi:hypothetical protein